MSLNTSRGYLLLEAAISGALLAAAMAIAIAFVAQGRTQVSIAANRASASALARSKADQLASGTACAATQALTNVGAGYPGFQWAWTSANATSMTASTPALSTEVVCHAVVTIEYPCLPRSREDASDGVPGNGRARLVAERMWHP